MRQVLDNAESRLTGGRIIEILLYFVGPLMKQMLANANLTINGTNTMTKFYMFSAVSVYIILLLITCA